MERWWGFVLILGFFIFFFLSKNHNNNNNENNIEITNNNDENNHENNNYDEIIKKNHEKTDYQTNNNKRTFDERRERVEELAKEFLKESEEWKESLIEREEILEEAQRIWSSLANKLDKTHLPNRIKLFLFPFYSLLLFYYFIFCKQLTNK